MPKRPLLGEMLTKEGVINKEQLDQALLAQKKSKKRLGRVLIELGFVPEEVVIEYLSSQITGILQECENNAPHLFTKPHELIRKKESTYKKTSFRTEEFEKEVDRRLYTGREKLGRAKELFKKGIYDEVISCGYHAIHHITQVLHDLQEYHGYFEITRNLGVKSIYTGRSGTSQVERCSVFADKISNEINPSTKHQAKAIIKDVEAYLRMVEKLFYQGKKELEDEI